jgi:hypothetical protein
MIYFDLLQTTQKVHVMLVGKGWISWEIPDFALAVCRNSAN